MSVHSNDDGDSLDFDSDEELTYEPRINDTPASVITLPSLSPLPTSVGAMTPLGTDYMGPGSLDVICGRGKEARLHSGNLKLRATIESKLEEYANASSKLAKSTIVSEILDGVRDDSPGGGFVRLENQAWFEVGDHMAREKIGQTFRDLLHTKYRSSTKAKRKKANFLHEGNPDGTVLGNNSNLSTGVLIQQHLLSGSMTAVPANRSSYSSLPVVPHGNDDDCIAALAGHASSISPQSPTQPGYFHSLNSEKARRDDDITRSVEYGSTFEDTDYRYLGLINGQRASLSALLLPNAEFPHNENPIDLKRSTSHETDDLKRSASKDTNDLKRSRSHESNDMKRSSSPETKTIELVN